MNITQLEQSLASVQAKIISLGAINLAAPDEIKIVMIVFNKIFYTYKY